MYFNVCYTELFSSFGSLDCSAKVMTKHNKKAQMKRA